MVYRASPVSTRTALDRRRTCRAQCGWARRAGPGRNRPIPHTPPKLLVHLMPCSHLQELYAVAEKHDLRISAADVVHIVCRQCDEHETCPSALTDGESVIPIAGKPQPRVATDATGN